MDCTKAQILSIPHIMGDLAPGSKQYQELEAHLAICRVCAQEYESSKETIEFIEGHKVEFAAAFEAIDRRKASEQEELERSWQCIQAKLAKMEAEERKEKQAKLYRLFVKASCAAACIAIGISIFLAYSIHSKPKIVTKPSPQQLSFAPKPSVRIELVSKNGSILIPAKQQIVSHDELKTLVINGKHRTKMNTNTILTVESLTENTNIGCLVKLTSGQIYTHVERDGNPFIVETSQGRTVITGTTFDIKATNDSTTLIVSEGTVRFESAKGVVKVAAGQMSKIVGQSVPSNPLSCNGAKLTAWATGYKADKVSVQIICAEDAYDVTELLLFGTARSIDLERINYDDWIEENRDWFKREFQWIFQLKDALAEEGIEVDYPQLLIKSGDIWQFVYPEVSSHRIAVLNSDLLLKVARNYNFDRQWLLEAVPTAQFAMNNLTKAKNKFFGIDAFTKWVESFDDVRKSSEQLDHNTLLYSLHASSYLAHTRALAWLGIKNGLLVFKREDKAKVLGLLEAEVEILNELCQKIFESFWADRPCDKHWELLDRITENISKTKGIEEEIAGYEILK